MKKFLIVLLCICTIISGIFIAKNILNENENQYFQSENNQVHINQLSNESTNQIANEKQVETEKTKELFEEYYNQAENILKSMTLEEKVGQMFLARYPESNVINEIKNEAPGGYVLFGRDFDNKTKQQMKDELNKNQQASKIPLILGVDEEGGTVVRVSSHKAFRETKFLSPQQIWTQGQLPAILEDSKEKSKLLKEIGLNMNLTPVADVPTNKNAFIYDRAYGRGAEKTAIYVSELIKTMNNDKMISAMKHFPGYGDNVDTHTGMAIDKRPYSTFEKSDFLPFKSGIEAKGPFILVSHNIVEAMDDKNPASLSKKVHQILKEDLQFTGLIITDDLAMKAVEEYVKNEEAAVQAVIAGNDMIISSDFTKQKSEIITAVKNNKIDENRINESVKKILACKYAYGIIK